jgi:hypothetical protein
MACILFDSISISGGPAREIKLNTGIKIIPKMKRYSFYNLLRLPNQLHRRKKAASRTHFSL